MGNYAKRLHRKLASKASDLPTEEPKRRPGELLPGGIKDLETLIKDGLDPIHAVYVFMQNFTAHFAEVVSWMPEMEVWSEAVAKTEEEYMPAGPPMSPLTGSYFWMWALCVPAPTANACMAPMGEKRLPSLLRGSCQGSE